MKTFSHWLYGILICLGVQSNNYDSCAHLLVEYLKTTKKLEGLFCKLMVYNFLALYFNFYKWNRIIFLVFLNKKTNDDLTFNYMEKILYSVLVELKGFLVVPSFVFLGCFASKIYRFLFEGRQNYTIKIKA